MAMTATMCVIWSGSEAKARETTMYAVEETSRQSATTAYTVRASGRSPPSRDAGSLSHRDRFGTTFVGLGELTT